MTLVPAESVQARIRRLVGDDTPIRRVLTARPWMSRVYFEARYLIPDPWRLANSPYERKRADDSIAALGGRVYPAALELGCGEGHFTARLLERCAWLVAVDFSALAIARARRRFRHAPRVEVRRGDLRVEEPGGPYDLIVCAELFYYLTPAEADALAARMARWLAPGGDLCLVHGTSRHDRLQGPAARGALGADAIHARFREGIGLHPIRGVDRLGYRILVLRRGGEPRRGPEGREGCAGVGPERA